MARKSKQQYYAVRLGRLPGIYDTWESCKQQVHGYPRAAFKGFATLAEAEAYMTSAAAARAPAPGAEAECSSAAATRPRATATLPGAEAEGFMMFETSAAAGSRATTPLRAPPQEEPRGPSDSDVAFDVPPPIQNGELVTFTSEAHLLEYLGFGLRQSRRDPGCGADA